MEDPIVRFGGALAAGYFVAGGVWPLLTGGAKRNLIGTALAIVGIAACPALIQAEHVVARALSCLWCLDLLFRVVDYARQMRRGAVDGATWQGYCAFLIPFPFLLAVYGQKQRTLSTQFNASELGRLVVGLLGFGLAVLLCLQSQQVAVLRQSFLLDHLVKVMLFAMAVESISQAQVAVERLGGFATVPIVDRAYLARTAAEFWYRYNQRVRHWLHVNVFMPCGGRRKPLTAVLAVFLVSAVFHEFFFALATSRLDGYQFSFFMLQAPAVLLSPGLERLAKRSLAGRVAAHGLTWLWFAATSPLFLHGVDRVFPFVYASEPWLP